MLDNHVEDVVTACWGYVTDSIWIGKPNFLILRLQSNGETDLAIAKAAELIDQLSDSRIMEIYNRYKDSAKIKWKESVKKIVGIPIATKAGLDI